VRVGAADDDVAIELALRDERVQDFRRGFRELSLTKLLSFD
jgi:hypothetical protein